MTPRRGTRRRRVLVTGATSFMGSHLVRRLLNEGCLVHALISPANNLRRLKDVQSSLALWKGDICHLGFVKKMVKDVKPQWIFHCAGFGVHPGQTDLQRLAQVNVLGMATLLTALEDLDFERLVTSGTSAEYGPSLIPFKETRQIAPETFYGATKAAATLLAQTFGLMKHKTVVTLRPFHVYGPGEEPTRLIHAAIRACLDDRPLKLTSLKEKRDFVYIDDVIQASMLAASDRVQGTHIFNIGSGLETTLGKVIEIIQHHTGKKIKVIEGAYENRPWKSLCWAADNQLARKVLGWKPRYQVKEGVAKTIEWMISLDRFQSTAL